MPSRLAGICPALRSVARQSRRPDRLILSLPRTSKREGKAYRLPPALLQLLAEEAWIEVNWLEWDAGPGTKLLGTLHWLKVQNVQPQSGDVLMVLDDDHEYLPFALKDLLEAQLAHGPQHVATYFTYFLRGIMVPQGADIIALQMDGDIAPKLTEYHAGFVDGDRACFLVDDLWIGFFFFLCGKSVKGLRHLVLEKGLQTVYTQTSNAKVEALEALQGDDRRDCATLRAFEGLLARLLAVGASGLAPYGGEAALKRLRQVEAEVRRAEARIAQLSAWVVGAHSTATCSRSARESAEGELAQLRHLYQMQAPPRR